MKVHSIRQLGKERLQFGDQYTEGDLSYIEAKLRLLMAREGEVFTNGVTT